MGKCAVITCNCYNDKKTRSTDLKFYRFPNDIKLCKQWVLLCGRKKDFPTQHAVVCSNHFPEDKRHTLQCRLLGNAGIKTRIKCVCRIPDGELPTLELPDTKNKSKLAIKLAEKLQEQKVRARKELVEELLRSSSYSDVPNVETPAPVVPPTFIIQYQPVPSTSQTTVNKPSNTNKRKAANSPKEVPAAKKPATKTVDVPAVKKMPFILPKPPVPEVEADNEVNTPLLVTLIPTLEEEVEVQTCNFEEVSVDTGMSPMDCKLGIIESIQPTLSDSEVTLSDIECRELEEEENIVLPLAIKDEPMEIFSGSEGEEREVESPLDTYMAGHTSLDDLCRICATHGEGLVYIFSEEGRRAQLKHKINNCMPITVCEEDSLPLVVCKVCILRLELSYKLSATCQQSDFKLRKIQKKLAKQGKTGLSAVDFCAVEVGGKDHDYTIPAIKQTKKSTTKPKISSETKPFKQKISSNNLPVLCKICNTLQCTTNDAVHHYLKFHEKSACEFCFEYFNNNQDLVTHINNKHIHSCKLCTFKIIGLGENILKNHIANVHLVNTKPHKISIKKDIVKKTFVLKRGPEKSGIYKCEICTLLYSSRLSLKKHYENVHKKYICISCFVEFKTKNELEYHVAENFHEIVCKHCNREFSSNRGLQNHTTLVHKNSQIDDEDEFECKDCNSLFVSQKNLRRHYLRVHAKFACSMCDILVNSKEAMEAHRKEQNHYTCEPCDVDFAYEEAYKLHVASHTIGTEFKCQTCDKTYTSRFGLKNHIKYIHLNIPYKYPCTLCIKKYKSPKKLHAHMKRHKNEKNINCPVCDKRFYDNEALKIHSRVHVTERKYICDQCGSKFTHQRNLSAHITGVHTSKWTYTCNECKYVTNNEEDIGLHCRTHQNNVLYARTSPYYCEECNKYFANRLHCLTHIRNHKILKERGYKAIEKLFECNQCQKKYSTKQLLKRHLGSHIEIKPYNCTICSRGFIEEKDLDVHMRIHTNVKPFSCNICEKAFHKKTNLTVHKRNVHQTIKRIPCPHCDKRFKRNQQLMIHIRVHTKEKPFFCDVCEQRFTQKGDMVRHRQRHDVGMLPRKQNVK